MKIAALSLVCMLLLSLITPSASSAEQDTPIEEHPQENSALSDNLAAYSNSPTGNPDGPVAYWRLDEGSGDAVHDESANNNDGTIRARHGMLGPSYPSNCPTVVDNGKYGRALRFDNINDYVEVPDSPSLNPTEQITLEVWVHIPADPDVAQTIFSKYLFEWNLGYQLKIESVPGNDFRIVFAIGPGGGRWGDTTHWLTYDTPFEERWWHLVGTYDGTTQKLYVDGALASSLSWSGTVAANDLSLLIGAEHWAGNHFWGLIDEARIYHRALNGSEVSTRYNDGEVDRMDLIAEWRFENVEGGIARDEHMWVDGKRGKALNFSIDDNVEVPESSSLEITDAITVEAWVYIPESPDQHRVILSKYLFEWDQGYILKIENVDGRDNFRVVFGLGPGSPTPGWGGNTRWLSYETKFERRWWHFAGTFDGENQKLYVDGELENSLAWTGTIALNDQMVLIGAEYYVPHNFDGIIDEVRIYDRALGADEVYAHYLASIDTTPPSSNVDPIVPYWQLVTPFTITATASDDLSGVENVELWYRYSRDNSTWGVWASFGVDTVVPWSWSFTAPNGYGYYEFYSIATDGAGNQEEIPELDTRCHYWYDMLMITNRQGLVGFARATGEADPDGKVEELLRVTRETHPEGVLVFLEEGVANPSNWVEIDSFVESFVRQYSNVRYLMIIGGPQIVPFYYTDDPTGHEEDIATDTLYGEVIGDDGYQDIAVGRIVGINIENMISLIRMANPQYYQTSSSAIVSCGDGGTRDTTNAINDILLSAGFSQEDILYLREDDPEWRLKYISGLPNRAIIAHQGHGDPYTFVATRGKGKKQTEQKLWWFDVRRSGLGSTNPVIYGGGCHTALIEEGDYRFWDRIYTIPQFAQDTISMVFLENGAASFVGYTRLSYFNRLFSAASETVGRALIEHLKDGEDIGSSLMHAKNSVWGWLSWLMGEDEKTWLTCILYGDPKFNPIFPSDRQTSTSLPTIGSSIELTIEVPEYSRTTVEGYDVINVPDARFLFNPGYPLVPILVKEFKLEEDHQLVAIELVEAELEEIENVNLLTDQIETSIPLPELEYPIIGLYPGITHGAEIYPHLDGSKTLRLVVAPLQYDKASEKVYLYRHMRFRLVAEPSPISATPAYWNDRVELGDVVQQEFEVRNLGPTPLEIELEKTGRIKEHVSFDIDIITLLPGEARKVTAIFTATGDIEVGTYAGEILVRSTQGGQSVPVTIAVFAPVPEIEITKSFQPAKIPEGTRRVVMSEVEITNLGVVEVEKLEVLDELLPGWTIIHPHQVQVFFVDNENREYLVSRGSFEVDLADGRVCLEINFAQGVKLYRVRGTKTIYSMHENEKIVMKYFEHSVGRLNKGTLEAEVRVTATSPEQSQCTIEEFAQLEVLSWKDWLEWLIQGICTKT